MYLVVVVDCKSNIGSVDQSDGIITGITVVIQELDIIVVILFQL